MNPSNPCQIHGSNPYLGRFNFTQTLVEKDSPGACDFFPTHTGLSKTRIKEAMNKGALWLKRRGRGRIRLRKATFRLQKGDTLELYCEPTLRNKTRRMYGPIRQYLD